MRLPTLAQIEDAQAIVYRHMPHTPQYSWPLIDQRLGTETWIKHENHTPVGAFKLRGALVYVSARSPSYALSFAQGKVVEAPSRTLIADGLACRTPNPSAMEVIWENVARIVEVSDTEIADTMRAYYQDTHNCAEGAAAAGLAGALKERSLHRGRKIGIVLTGGNVDASVFAKVLTGESFE